MRVNMILAAIMAMFAFALADQTITHYLEATTTITMTLTNYNATTTMYYATGTGGSSAYSAATTYSKPSLSATPVASPSSYKGAASAERVNIAAAGLLGLAAVAFAL